MDKIMDLIYEACDSKAIYRNRDVDLFETGLLDSMSFINLLTCIEDEFNFEINSEDIKKECFSTPNKIIEYVERHM